MKKKLPAWAVLMIICLVAGISLALVNMLTEDRIKEQEALTRNATRAALLPSASNFEDVELQESRFSLDSLVRGLDTAGNTLGYVGQSTVSGYGGPVSGFASPGMGSGI